MRAVSPATFFKPARQPDLRSEVPPPTGLFFLLFPRSTRSEGCRRSVGPSRSELLLPGLGGLDRTEQDRTEAIRTRTGKRRSSNERSIPFKIQCRSWPCRPPPADASCGTSSGCRRTRRRECRARQGRRNRSTISNDKFIINNFEV